MTGIHSERTWRCTPSQVREALDALRRFGGVVEGGDSAGTMKADTPLGPVEGRYAFDGEEFRVEVTRKPPMVPLEMIWGRIDRICGPPAGRA